MKSALVIINPISGAGRANGGGTAEVDAATTALARGGYHADVVVTTGPGHASQAARQARSRAVDLVVSWGGDGTMNEIARELAFGDVPLALVPAGSGNGLARDLGVPRQPLAALEAAATGHPWRIDAGEVNGGLFFNVAGLGLDARIAHAFAANRGRRGLWRYAQIGTRELLRYTPRHYAISADQGAPESTRALFIALANSRQYGGGGCIAPRARLDDGQLELVTVANVPMWRVVTRLPEFFGGRLQPGGGVAMQPVRRVRLTTEGAWELHLDGEPRQGSGAIDVCVRPQALTVVVPRDSTTPRASTD